MKLNENKIEVIRGNCTEIQVRGDVMISNPPFGNSFINTDIEFLKNSLCKDNFFIDRETRRHLFEKFSKENNFKIFIEESEFLIKKTKFKDQKKYKNFKHKKSQKSIKTIFIHL